MNIRSTLPAALAVIAAVVVLTATAPHARSGDAVSSASTQDKEKQPLKKPKGDNSLSLARKVALKAFPKARIVEVESTRVRVQIPACEVEIEHRGSEIEVTVTPDGQILSVEREISRRDLPKAVADAIGKHRGRARVSEVEAVEVHAEWKAVPLDKPAKVYEVELKRGRREGEMLIAEDGTVLRKPRWYRDDADDDDDDHDDDDDDDDDDHDDDDEDDD